MRNGLTHFVDKCRSAWRFRWLALGCAWLVAVVGWIVVFSLPGRYDTQARVFLDMTSSLRPLLEGLAVTPNTANQVEIVRRALLGRPQLERVIATTGLAQRAQSLAGHDALLTQLTTKIRITGDVQTRNYSITYSDADPAVSYAVVKNLLDAFVEQSMTAKRTDSVSAQKFLTEQIREYEARLTESERQLADFKRRNVGSMPDDRGGYFERLQAEMSESDRLGAALAVATRRRDELRQRLLGKGATRGGSQMETSVDTRLLESRRQLGELLLNYTEAHPDVIALQEVIVALAAQRQAEIDQLRRNVDSLGSARTGSGNLVQQNLQISLNEVEVEVASLRAQIADRKVRVENLRSEITTLPEVEAELSRLNRDYGTNRVQYDALLQRLESARLSEQAEKSQDVIFNIVEPPSMPVVPAAPNRIMLACAVLVAAFGAGAGAAYLLSLLRPVYLGEEQLREAFAGVLVIGGVGLMRNAKAVRGERLRLVLYGSLASALVIVLGLLLLAYRQWGTLNPLLPGASA